MVQTDISNLVKKNGNVQEEMEKKNQRLVRKLEIYFNQQENYQNYIGNHRGDKMSSLCPSSESCHH